ncbi:uncharacterized protein Z520_03126 [Fonsecaea multimorphosa CBS 102226]|uniref:Phosphatidylinositol-specific phospholipase C X domain-containing protein n=1 Tax=Fonsecaea multimorphosa CBS 102226 TaxID=1442371 RepID=A0A0D2KXM4_9EURO|nr:uncharacterized protein Z520_03126 [Fonsecaea multimorphosa CBS 102226]KIY01574.1 hypothetical protein Z520_03126 [Fonsecaea multimorphosa CBS 102226]OAL28088.1 hypothetical protein AYO22_03115 [Fonsecaea multimorphosa]
MHLQSLLSFVSLLSLSVAASVNKRQSTACNNSPSLCSKPYNSIVHLGAHDSPFVRDASTDYSTSGDQYYNSTVQLSAGVRLLSAQVHKSNGEYHLCHSSCDLLDAGVLSNWLEEIKTWLDNNPNEVVTVLLVNSDNATPEDLGAHFTTAQITNYAYVPPSTSTPPASGTWPTLQELINANKRLLVFVASISDPSSIPSQYAYLMDEFTFIFENPYDNTSPSNFTCLPDRPTAVQGNTEAAIASNRMAFTNHFLYEEGLFDIETPNVADINVTNSPGNSVGNLGYSLSQCNSMYGKPSTFVLVDFFDQGPAIAAVDAMNGVTNPVGRTAVPPRDSKSSSDSRSQSSFQGVVNLVNEVKEGQKPKLGAWIWAAGQWTFGGINLSGGNVFQK